MTGCPESNPVRMASRNPFSMAGTNSLSLSIYTIYIYIDIYIYIIYI